VIAVPGLVPDDVFFEHLANRRFPSGNFIRKPHELDYLEEPDVFHDVFGHVPMLMNPAIADYIQAYGVGGQRAQRLGKLANLARVYWYTVEFGLLRQKEGLRIYGAGIASSFTESVFALDSPSPNRLGFDLERVMRTHYRIDDFQETYFVIDDLDQLLELARIDFAPVYERLGDGVEHQPGDALSTDTTPGARGSEDEPAAATRRDADRRGRQSRPCRGAVVRRGRLPARAGRPPAGRPGRGLRRGGQRSPVRRSGLAEG
jgi:phenylalanine-4-hydroxylase